MGQYWALKSHLAWMVRELKKATHWNDRRRGSLKERYKDKTNLHKIYILVEERLHLLHHFSTLNLFISNVNNIMITANTKTSTDFRIKINSCTILCFDFVLQNSMNTIKNRHPMIKKFLKLANFRCLYSFLIQMFWLLPDIKLKHLWFSVSSWFVHLFSGRKCIFCMLRAILFNQILDSRSTILPQSFPTSFLRNV